MFKFFTDIHTTEADLEGTQNYRGEQKIIQKSLSLVKKQQSCSNMNKTIIFLLL